MTVSSALKREKEHNMKFETMAIFDYTKFYRNLMRDGYKKEATIILHILHEEEQHLRMLRSMF